MIFLGLVVEKSVVHALENLNTERNWNVIVVCYRCPVSQRILVNRFVQTLLAQKKKKKKLKSLVRNPDFNKFEYLKHVKLDDERLKCLKNKTIYSILDALITHDVLENIALLF